MPRPVIQRNKSRPTITIQRPSRRAKQSKQSKPIILSKSTQKIYDYRQHYHNDEHNFRWIEDKEQIEHGKTITEYIQQCKKKEPQRSLEEHLEHAMDQKANVHRQLVEQQKEGKTLDTKLRQSWTFFDNVVSALKREWTEQNIERQTKDRNNLYSSFSKTHKKIEDDLFFQMIDLQIAKEKRKPDEPTQIWKVGRERTKHLTYDTPKQSMVRRVRRQIQPKRRVDEPSIDEMREQSLQTYHTNIHDPYDPNLLF